MDTNQTAILLKRAKQQSVRRSQFPKPLREKQLREKMNYYKAQMLEAISENDTTTIAGLKQKLIRTRAQQVALALQDNNGQMILDAGEREKQLKHYYKDCYTLSHRVQAFLDTPKP